MPSTRRTVTGIDASGPCPVEYRFTPSKSGNRHLTVVFANLFAPDDYGWGTGVLDGLRSNILWIRDRFDGGNTYYLCRGMDFSVERSVIGLITRVMQALRLTPGDVTLWGSSKGGSAALYFGLRYGFRNIVASVPQLAVGTFVRDVYPDTGRHMLGDSLAPENVAALDRILPELLTAGANPQANIYLVSSPQDEQYATQVEPYVGLLQRYPNFNFIYSESPHITDHGKVTLRNVPPLLAIGYLLAEGIAPKIGVTRHNYEEPDHDTTPLEAFLAETAVQRDESEFPPPVVLHPSPHSAQPAAQVRFVGSAPGAVRVSIWENGKFLGTPAVAADGGWTWELGRPWAPGRHQLKIFAVSEAGFQSPRAEVVFTAAAHATAG